MADEKTRESTEARSGSGDGDMRGKPNMTPAARGGTGSGLVPSLVGFRPTYYLQYGNRMVIDDRNSQAVAVAHACRPYASCSCRCSRTWSTSVCLLTEGRMSASPWYTKDPISNGEPPVTSHAWEGSDTPKGIGMALKGVAPTWGEAEMSVKLWTTGSLHGRSQQAVPRA